MGRLPDVGRVAHGVAARVDRLRCLGNGQVPAVAALAWRILNNQDQPS
jgi:DNA (cytosine-5)-methyltransferase 1